MKTPRALPPLLLSAVGGILLAFSAATGETHLEVGPFEFTLSGHAPADEPAELAVEPECTVELRGSLPSVWRQAERTTERIEPQS